MVARAKLLGTVPGELVGVNSFTFAPMWIPGSLDLRWQCTCVLDAVVCGSIQGLQCIRQCVIACS